MKTNQQPELEQSITTLFLDIGGVLLTNGWGGQGICHVDYEFTCTKLAPFGLVPDSKTTLP